jgi:hypothetical protein
MHGTYKVKLNLRGGNNHKACFVLMKLLLLHQIQEIFAAYFGVFYITLLRQEIKEL